MGSLSERAMREEGQMAVELAVVLPIVLAVLVIAVDCLSFVGECARFDNLAPQKVLSIASSPDMTSYSGDARCAAVAAALRAGLPAGAEAEVTSRSAGQAFSNIVTYDCTLRIPPWPLKGSGIAFFGVQVPMALVHKTSLSFDPYTPGDLL